MTAPVQHSATDGLSRRFSPVCSFFVRLWL